MEGRYHQASATPCEYEDHARHLHFDKPAAPQTFLFAGGIGAPRSTPDYVPLEVMNNALGGLFSSRLNMNLREEHGYTYGAFSVFAYRRGPGFLVLAVP